MQASDFSIGRLPNGTGPWVLNQPTPGTPNVTTAPGNGTNVRINEWMANPKGSDSDYLELYNPNAQPVSIGGLFLTDDLNDRTKHPIAPLSFIGSFTNGFVKFIADNSPSKGANHLGFSLSAAGEVVALFPATGAAIDAITFGAQANGVSEGRLPDGSTNIVRFPTSPTPGESNYLPLDDIVVNEALTHTDLPLEDAIELANRSSKAVSVGGWFLSDSTDDLRKYRIPDGTVIQPGQFLVVYEYQFNPNPGFAPNFALSSAHGDQIYLSAADASGNFTGFRDVEKFGAQENGVSFGRWETTEGVDFTTLLSRSFGTDNPTNVAQFRTGTGATNPAVKVGPVVINEILYHPPDIGTNDNVIDEFIELRNVSATAVSLYHTNYPTNTWHLRNAVDFNFPTNVSMPANSFLLVVSFNPTNAAQLAAFRSKYGVSAGIPVYGPYSGKLDNSSESIELNRPDAPELPPSSDAGFVPRILVDHVKFKDNAPWPSLADGATNGVGYSLQRRVSSAYGNEPTNWLAGVPTPGLITGAAATNLPVITAAPTNLVVPPGFPASFSVTATGAAPIVYQWRYNGTEIANATNSSLSILNAQTNHEGRYSVWVANAVGAALSSNATLSIQSPPIITTQPQNQVALAGGTAMFNVVAGGSTPLRYEWRKNGGAIGNATNASFLISNAQVTDQGNYSVVITNIFGSITSVIATLTINVPPGISAQPQPQTVNQGDTATFAVSATGDAPLRYQWRRNGTSVTGGTNDTLLLTNVQPAQAGNYTVVVTNFVGSTTSSVAALTVVALPVVTIVATDAAAAEAGPDSGVFTISRSFATNAALMVNIAIGGSASNGVDYAALAGPVTIPANAASTTLVVSPIDDSQAEPPESVIVVISAGAGYTVGSPNNATVTIADNDNIVPSVTVTNPPGDTLYVVTPTNIVLSAEAADTDGTVAKVEFYWRGTNKLGEDLTAPYSITWSNAPAGSNALVAIATDDLGGRGTSAPVYLVLNAQPTVSITSPANGASFAAPADITISATAADSDGSVTQVQFFNGAAVLGEDPAAPFSFTWTNVALGTYSLTARATDDRGAVRTSTVVSVTVRVSSATLTDLFADRQTIGGYTNSVTGSNVGATKETGEPNHGNDAGGHSVWIAWTAPATGTAVADTLGSSFDTTLGVWRGTAVNALTSVAQNNNISAGNTRSRVTFTATNGVIYNIAVDGNLAGGVTPSGSVVLNFGMLPATNPPSITTQPQSQTVARGATATFSVTAGGSTPLSYQWRYDGTALPGATNATLSLTNAQGHQEGNYSVIVSNPYGTATSAAAALTVNDGLITSQQIRLLTYSNEWRYEQSGADLGTAWKDPGYNDAAWPAGGGLLGFETTPAIYPEPFRTTLDISNNAVATLTYYFRTHLQFTNAGAAVTFHATNYIDDGAVWYLNGAELARVRMLAGAPTYATLAVIQNAEGTSDEFTVVPTNLVVGDNVLAAEVHQTTAGSSDVVFGMALAATIAATNHPVIVNPQWPGNGSFQGTLMGIAGRVYAVDFTAALGASWTPLITFTNVSGQTSFTDPDAASDNSRFYRGRLLR